MNYIECSNIEYIKKNFELSMSAKNIVKHIKFDECYIFTCDEEMFHYLESDKIPDPTIKYLIFTYFSNNPKNRQYYIDSNKFNKKFANIEGVLFKWIRILPYSFEQENNAIIKNDYIGLISGLKNLTYLYIGDYEFNDDKFYRLPNTIKHLEMFIKDDYDLTDILDILPNSLETFITSNIFESKLTNLPFTLKKLVLFNVNIEFTLDYLPASLEELIVYNSDDKIIIADDCFNNLPSRLKTLMIYKYVSSLENLPLYLENLIIIEWKYEGIIRNLPEKLNTFICYKLNGIEDIIFPKNLEKLIITEHDDKIIEKFNLPDTISTIGFQNITKLIENNFKFPKNLKQVYNIYLYSVSNYVFDDESFTVIDTRILEQITQNYCIVYLDDRFDYEKQYDCHCAPMYSIITDKIKINFKTLKFLSFYNVIIGNYFPL